MDDLEDLEKEIEYLKAPEVSEKDFELMVEIVNQYMAGMGRIQATTFVTVLTALVFRKFVPDEDNFRELVTTHAATLLGSPKNIPEDVSASVAKRQRN